MELSEIRDNIDYVDKKLKASFLERMKLVKGVLEYKRENNLPVKNYQREEEMIKRLTKDICEYKEETERFFRNVIDISCDYQEKGLKKETEPNSDEDFYKSVKTVYYSGVAGAYAHEAAYKKFPEKNIVSKESFRDVVNAVYEDELSVGVLPFENLIGGRIWEVSNLLLESNLYIVDKTSLKIHHCLLGLSDFDDIRCVESHPQALVQCEKFIKENGFSKIERINTAVAAKELKDKSVGVIGSPINAGLYNLKILKENIADVGDNETKFIIVSKNQNIFPDANTLSVAFTLPHKVGSLSGALNEFMKNDLNLTFIQSVPLRTSKWEYLFYADINGNLLDKSMKEKLEKISNTVEKVKILGNY